MPLSYTYNSPTNSYYVTGGCGDATITIPDTYNDGTNGVLPVTAISSSAFLNCTSLTTLVIGNNVTIIGASAFKGCTNLSSVTFPTSSLTTISSSAFWGTALVNVVIPNSVTALSHSIFVDCASLASLTLPTNGTIATVPQGLCVSCTSLTSITIPSNYTTISTDAFIFAGLQTVTLNEGLIQINEQAFYGCPLIGTLIIPDSVLRLRPRAFEKTGPDIYSPPGSRLDIVIGTGLEEIYSHCFWESSVNSISFKTPSSLDYIGPGAFNSCGDLENLYLPDTNTLSIQAHSLDEGCNYYLDAPFDQAIKLEGTLRIPDGFDLKYVVGASGPPCVPIWSSPSEAAIGFVLSNITAKNIILGKSITYLAASSMPLDIIFDEKSITFEGKVSFIGAQTFWKFGYSYNKSYKLYFYDFADSLIIEDYAFSFRDKIFLIPKTTVRIN